MNARKLVGVIGLLALTVPAWAFLAPPSIGGTTVYAAVSGSSMQPVLAAGDLVVLRPAASYGVGDVVAYRSSAGGAVMLHRIISAAGGRFTLKGDANGWLDADTPTRADIVGEMWFSVPHAGALIQRAPWLIGLALAALVAFAARFTRRKHARVPVAASVAPEPLAPAAPGPDPVVRDVPEVRAATDARTGVAVSAVLTLAFMMLGAISVMRPMGVQT